MALPTNTRTPLANNPNTFGPGIGLSTSGTTSGNETGLWRIHIQNVEIMYVRTTQYKTTDGTADFNYLDLNYTCDVTREHIYWNASSGDLLQHQTLDLISDSTVGAMGVSGVVKTQQAGILRRIVKAGDVESQNRISGNVITDKQPGLYNSSFDTSANTNSVILDALTAIKTSVNEFELALVRL